MIIGNKKKFAIEYLEPSQIRIWIEEQYIGTLDDETTISGFCAQLNRALELIDSLIINDLGTSPDEMFSALLEEETGKHILSLGDSFDDFCILFFKYETKIFFIWKLEDEPFFDYPSYSEGIKYGKVDVNDIATPLREITNYMDRHTNQT